MNSDIANVTKVKVQFPLAWGWNVKGYENVDILKQAQKINISVVSIFFWVADKNSDTPDAINPSVTLAFQMGSIE